MITLWATSGELGETDVPTLDEGEVVMHAINADALDEAVRQIDKAFGPGYAKAHSELVAALVQAAAFDRVARVIEDHPASGELVRKTLAELTEMMEELEHDTRINGHDAELPTR
jgi:hypothetical protein